jgi:hypothetical protein
MQTAPYLIVAGHHTVLKKADHLAAGRESGLAKTGV